MRNQNHLTQTMCFASELLLVSVLCLLGLKAYGQGTVYFQNVAPGVIPIMNSLTGQRAESGTTFSVALYFAIDGVIDEGQFNQLGSSVSLAAPGYFLGGVRTAPIFPPGGFGMFQVRAWETLYGATYEEAVANAMPQNGRLALAGESGIMRVDTADPTIPEPGVPTLLVGPGAVAVVGAPLRDGFVLSVVPEPCPALVLLLALPSIFFLPRRSK